jgi:hypothetical protein
MNLPFLNLKLPNGDELRSETENGCLVARLLPYPHHLSSLSTWSKSDEHLNENNFLDRLEKMRKHTKFPTNYTIKIRDLENFEHWEHTNLTTHAELCYQIQTAKDNLIALQQPLRDLEIKAKPSVSSTIKTLDTHGYYIRKDFSNMRRVFVLGDIHGSLHSLCDVLLDIKDEFDRTKKDGGARLKDDVAVVCLGDVLDRSPYALDCLYLLLRLYNANTENCVFLCGNHETHTNLWFLKDGSYHEMNNEYANKACSDMSGTLVESILQMTNLMPSSLIAKTSVGKVQFNHGAFEPRYKTCNVDESDDPKDLTFKAFVNFENVMGPNVCYTRHRRTYNFLQWGDVEISAPDEGSQESQQQRTKEARTKFELRLRTDQGQPVGRIQPDSGRVAFSSEEVKKYLDDFGLQMIVRGHSDMANLSLLYKDGAEPSEDLNKEGEQERSDREKEGDYFIYNGKIYTGKRDDDQKQRNWGHFIRKAQFIQVPKPNDYYDMYTLVTGPNMKTFSKTLIKPEYKNTDMIAVTVSSCPFSKPNFAVQLMSCYLELCKQNCA